MDSASLLKGKNWTLFLVRQNLVFIDFPQFTKVLTLP